MSPPTTTRLTVSLAALNLQRLEMPTSFGRAHLGFHSTNTSGPSMTVSTSTDLYPLCSWCNQPLHHFTRTFHHWIASNAVLHGSVDFSSEHASRSSQTPNTSTCTSCPGPRLPSSSYPNVSPSPRYWTDCTGRSLFPAPTSWQNLDLPWMTMEFFACVAGMARPTTSLASIP